MNFKQKVTAVQIAILKKYGVIVDVSNLTDSQLDQALKCSVSVKEASTMTFAGWCDRIFGTGVRVPVARFSETTAGQISLSNIVAGKTLSEGLRASERSNKAALKALQSDLENRAGKGAPDSRSDIEVELSSWYGRIRVSLQEALLAITDINGAISDYQGPTNYEFRDKIAKLINSYLGELVWLGMENEVTLRDSSDDPKAGPDTSLISHVFDEVDSGVVLIEFTIRGLREDGLAGDYWPWRSDKLSSDSESSGRIDCHVKIKAREWGILQGEELSYLSCFVEKLFEAWAKAGDRRSRGALREALILCQMLAYTAPSHSLDAFLEHGISYGGYGIDDFSPGDVVGRFFRLIQDQARLGTRSEPGTTVV